MGTLVWGPLAQGLLTSAIIGPRTTDHVDDLLAGIDVVLGDDVLDRIDEIVPPGTDVGALDQDYRPPAPGIREPAPPSTRRTRSRLRIRAAA